MSADLHILITLGVALGLIVLDFLVGVARSLIPPVTFSIQKFPGALSSAVLPLFIPLVGLAVVQFFAPVINVTGAVGASDGTFYVAAAAVIVKTLADVVTKLSAFNQPAAAAAAGQAPALTHPNDPVRA